MNLAYTIMTMTVIMSIIYIHSRNNQVNMKLENEEDIKIMNKEDVKEFLEPHSNVIFDGDYKICNADTHSFLSSDIYDSTSNEMDCDIWNIKPQENGTVRITQKDKLLQYENPKYASVHGDGNSEWKILYDDKIKAFTIHTKVNNVSYYLFDNFKLKTNITYRSKNPISKAFWYIHEQKHSDNDKEKENENESDEEIIEVYNDSDSYDEM